MRCFCAHVKGRRKISLALSLLIGFILIAGAAVAVPVPVLAISASGIRGTIASIIISLLLQTGVAPTNTEWLNQLNTAYGVSSTIGTIEDCITNGLLTETSSGLVDTGLSNAIASAPEYTSLGLDTIFGTSATDAGVTVATGATNLANTAANVGTLGTIGAYAGAASIGVGLGVLINHVRERFIDYIRQGVQITYNDEVINQAPAGTRVYISAYGSYGSTQYRVNYNFFPIQSVICAYKSTDWKYILVGASKNPGVYTYKSYLSPSERLDKTGSTQIYSYPNATGWYGGSGNWGTPKTNVPIFASEQACKDYVQQKMDDPNYNFTPYSPDLIGPYGNQSANVNTNTGEVETPGIKPMVPNGSDMKPVDMDDYNDYVENANQNTEDGLTGENNQGAEFTEFINPYIVPYEEILPDPEPDEPLIPEYPDEIPEYPDRPVTPDQPTIPDKPNIPSEDIETNLDLTTTPDLRGIFPFCIPWDIYNLVLIFDTGENRQAPHITFTFPGTDWVIDVDLAAFDPVAGILRILELILFIVGLMVATRSLIGAGG